jgi:hypothetical protein
MAWLPTRLATEHKSSSNMHGCDQHLKLDAQTAVKFVQV